MCKSCIPLNACKTKVSLHNHTDYSNIRLLDSVNTVEDLVKTALDLGYKGLAITEHEFIGSHHKAIKYVENGKKIDPKTGKSEIPQDFKLILGNEIYLVENAKWCEENYSNPDVEVKFFHYLLLAKNADGHKALRKLSSRAWKNSFRTGLMERVPTEEWYLEQIVKEFPNTLIATSACMGGRIPYEIMKGNLEGARDYIKWNISLFGKEDFYLELQPATYEDQIHVNKHLVQFAEEFGLKLIITSDAHYARPEDAPIHEAFLNAKEGDREVADFYGHTYLHTIEEIYHKMDYLPAEVISQALENTLEIGDKVEEYSLEQETIIPKIAVPEFKLRHLFKQWYDNFEYIGKMCNSEEVQDKYLMHLIEEGFLELIPFKQFTSEKFFTYLDRINKEVGELWELSEKMKQAVSSYYVTTARLVDIIWGDDECEGSFESGSLVGHGRGSAVAFLINYLMKITMVNPLEHGIEIPHWRLA